VDDGSRARVVDERDVARIREAVETVLATPGFRELAQAIAATMADAPSADEILATFLDP
jgi:hypothetical protein